MRFPLHRVEDVQTSTEPSEPLLKGPGSTQGQSFVLLSNSQGQPLFDNSSSRVRDPLFVSFLQNEKASQPEDDLSEGSVKIFSPIPTSSKPLLGRPSVFRLQKYEEVLLENHSVVVVVVQQPTSFSSSFSSRHEFTQTSRNLPTPMSSIGGGFSFLFLVCFPRKRLYLISD